MRKLTTILCSIAFAISGICLAEATATRTMSSQTVSAATMPNVNLNDIKPPIDLLLSLKPETKDSIRSPGKSDTVYIEKPAVITKKSVKARAPRRVKTKTVHVPVLYIATRTDVKEDTVDHKPTYMYKVHKVGEYDLKKLSSSTDVN